MGFPKHRIRIGDRSILQHLIERLGGAFDEVLIVGAAPTDLPSRVRCAEDLHPIRSPLAGIHSGLTAAAHDLSFVIGCDMPHVHPSLVKLLIGRSTGADVVVPRVGGFYEPLCAAYRRTALPAIERAIERRCHKITAVYEDLRVVEILEADVREADPELRSFININTRDQLTAIADTRFSGEPFGPAPPTPGPNR